MTFEGKDLVKVVHGNWTSWHVSLICWPFGYSHAGLNIGVFDVCVSSSGKLCHFLFAVHYLTSFAVLGGTYSRCMQQVRKNN